MSANWMGADADIATLMADADDVDDYERRLRAWVETKEFSRLMLMAFCGDKEAARTLAEYARILVAEDRIGEQPEIKKYLDRSLAALTAGEPADLAFGIRRRRALSKTARKVRSRLLPCYWRAGRLRSSSKCDGAFDLIADEIGVSVENVERVYKDFKAEIAGTVIEAAWTRAKQGAKEKRKPI